MQLNIVQSLKKNKFLIKRANVQRAGAKIFLSNKVHVLRNYLISILIPGAKKTIKTRAQFLSIPVVKNLIIVPPITLRDRVTYWYKNYPISEFGPNNNHKNFNDISWPLSEFSVRKDYDTGCPNNFGVLTES